MFWIRLSHRDCTPFSVLPTLEELEREKCKVARVLGQRKKPNSSPPHSPRGQHGPRSVHDTNKRRDRDCSRRVHRTYGSQEEEQSGGLGHAVHSRFVADIKRSHLTGHLWGEGCGWTRVEPLSLTARSPSRDVRTRYQSSGKAFESILVCVTMGAIGSLSTRTGDHDGNVSETIKLIAEDKRSTWICEIGMISGWSCLTCASFVGCWQDASVTFEKLPQSLFRS